MKNSNLILFQSWKPRYLVQPLDNWFSCWYFRSLCRHSVRRETLHHHVPLTPAPQSERTSGLPNSCQHPISAKPYSHNVIVSPVVIRSPIWFCIDLHATTVDWGKREHYHRDFFGAKCTWTVSIKVVAESSRISPTFLWILWTSLNENQINQVSTKGGWRHAEKTCLVNWYTAEFTCPYSPLVF